MKTSLFVLCPLLLCFNAGFVGFVRAQPSASSPAGSSLDPKIKSSLDRLRGIMHDTQSLTYDGEARLKMPDGKRFAVTKAKVTAEVQDNVWKFLVDGTFEYEYADGKAPKKAAPVTIRAAYDGEFALGLMEKEKAVRRFRTTDPLTVRTEFNQSDAAGPVIWDLFARPPFGSIDSAAKFELLPQETVGDVQCDVIWVVPASVSGAGPVVPYRAFLNSKNSLPVKMEYFKPAAARLPADKRGEPAMVLTLSNLKTTAEPSGATFEFEPPAGFSLKGSKEPKKAPSAAAPAADPAPAPTPVPAASTGTYKYPLARSNDEALRVGTAAPAFKLNDFEGKERTLEEFKGKVLVLDFWGTWCPPCRMAMPAVQTVHEKYKDRGVVVLGMNFEQNPKADPEKFKKDKGYTYQSLAKAQTVSGAYKVPGWPTFYVIGRDGKVVWAGVGLESPPGGTSSSNQTDVVNYLESNLSQAIDKALTQP